MHQISKEKNQERPNKNRFQQNSQRNGQNYRGKGIGRFNNPKRLRCQIYEKYRHTAVKCYFRFYQSYGANQQSNNSQKGFDPNINLAHSNADSRNQNNKSRSQSEMEQQAKLDGNTI